MSDNNSKSAIEIIDETLQLIYELTDGRLDEEQTQRLLQSLRVVYRASALMNDQIKAFARRAIEEQNARLDAEGNANKLRGEVERMLRDGDTIMRDRMIGKMMYKLDLSHDEACKLFNSLTVDVDNTDDAFMSSGIRNAFLNALAYERI